MSAVTRRALRVYAALSELRSANEDVLDALIPFFEPVLGLLNKKVFDPKLLAVGVQKLYRWRFNKDIAENFIPRLVRKKYLTRKAPGVYVVDFVTPAVIDDKTVEFEAVLKEIVDKFVEFAPRVTDLRNYTRSQEGLTDLLIRFLVSLQGYGDASFAAHVTKSNLATEELSKDERNLVAQLPEGGEAISVEDRYMCARFLSEICASHPQYIPHLARLASVGLLTEVVDDFAKPTGRVTQADLTIVLDAPVALDLLGCSGKALKDDLTTILDPLRSIGCKLVVFPITCREMTRNLESMLSKPRESRFGYTHEAMCRGEVLEDFVKAVARDPQQTLESVHVKVRDIKLEDFPHLHRHFSKERHEDFFSSILWAEGIEPREHDAACVTLLMRLREGKNSPDMFRCGHVMVTRNPRYASHTRSYCINSHLLGEAQESPVVHQRELATTSWLRTGLGVNDDIPRGQLLATCDRVLRVRMEVRDAIQEKLKLLTPEKAEQLDILLLDQRSVRKLADETLNDESVITSENASALLDAMRRATIEEERKSFEQTLDLERKAHAEEAKKASARAEQLAAERDSVRAELDKRAADENARTENLVESINRRMRILEIGGTATLFALGLAAVVNFFTGWFASLSIWSALLATGGAFSLYHMTMNALEWRKVGLATILSWVSSAVLKARLKQMGLDVRNPFSDFEINSGQISRKSVLQDRRES